MARKGLMTAAELNMRCSESVLDLAIEKWVRLGGRHSWVLLKAKGAVDRYLKMDTCPLCRRHYREGEFGPKKWSHCLSSTASYPCPLVDPGSENLFGCGPESLWYQARRAVDWEQRHVFMKARAKILRRLRAAKAWY